jgi:hypothetical protein
MLSSEKNSYLVVGVVTGNYEVAVWCKLLAVSGGL